MPPIGPFGHPASPNNQEDAESGELDYGEVERLAREHRPRLIIAGFSAYARVVDWRRFRAIADAVGAWLLVDMAHVAA